MVKITFWHCEHSPSPHRKNKKNKKEDITMGETEKMNWDNLLKDSNNTSKSTNETKTHVLE